MQPIHVGTVLAIEANARAVFILSAIIAKSLSIMIADLKLIERNVC